MSEQKYSRMHHIGELMRFITPALITIALFMLNSIDRRVERLEQLGERVAKVEATLDVQRRNR